MRASLAVATLLSITAAGCVRSHPVGGDVPALDLTHAPDGTPLLDGQPPVGVWDRSTGEFTHGPGWDPSWPEPLPPPPVTDLD